jgi:hypothetical protein
MASKIIDLALQSIKGKITIRNIQALIVLLTWSMSRDRHALDPNFLLSGTLLNTSVQIGLHTPLFSQEYSRDKLDLTMAEFNTRVLLWAYSVMTYQR